MFDTAEALGFTVTVIDLGDFSLNDLETADMEEVIVRDNINIEILVFGRK